jgi:hypothetical protein
MKEGKMGESRVSVSKKVVASAVVLSGVSAFGLAAVTSGSAATSNAGCFIGVRSGTSTAATSTDIRSLIIIPACDA